MDNLVENRKSSKGAKIVGLCIFILFSSLSSDVDAKENGILKETKDPIATTSLMTTMEEKFPNLFKKEEAFLKVDLSKMKEEQQENKNLIQIHGYSYEMQPGELAFLKRVVYAESRGASVEEQMATTETILNRVVQNKSSITEVLIAKGQFQCVKSDGNVYTGLEPDLVLVTDERVSKEVSDAVEAAVYGEDDITESLLTAEAIRLGLDPKVYAEGGALYFYEPDPSIISEQELDSRANIKVKVKIGDGEHFYYRVWDD